MRVTPAVRQHPGAVATTWMRGSDMAEDTCACGCGASVKRGRRFRQGHYAKWKQAQAGDPWRVDETTGCWVFTGHLNDSGYGIIVRKAEGRPHIRAHRYYYELSVGSVPEGLVLDHLCRNRACVNPAHLEPVTNAENVARGAFAMRTHCPKGHPYDEVNTYVGPNGGGRQCVACRAEYRAWYLPAWRARRLAGREPTV